MNEKHIAKASVFFAVIGLTLMYASSLYINIEEVDIAEIEKAWAGRNVKVSGKAVEPTKSGGHLFMTVNDSTAGIKVVKFDSGKSFDDGDRVEVTGHVEIYKGKLEIIAKKVKEG